MARSVISVMRMSWWPIILAVFLLIDSSSSLSPRVAKLCRLNTNFSRRKFQRMTMLRVVTDDDDDERPKLQMQEDDLGPRVSVRSYEEVIQSPSKPSTSSSSETRSSQSSSGESSSISTESSVFGSLSVDDLSTSRGFNRRSRGVSEKSGKLVSKEDLNGIEPSTPFIFAPVPAFMSVASWQISNFLSAHFAVQFVDSEVYPVQRLAIVSRNILVGLFTLSTGFTAAITVGLLMLGVAVSVGVAKGELDPKKKKPESAKDSIPGSIKRLF